MESPFQALPFGISGTRFDCQNMEWISVGSCLQQCISHVVHDGCMALIQVWEKSMPKSNRHVLFVFAKDVCEGGSWLADAN